MFRNKIEKLLTGVRVKPVRRVGSCSLDLDRVLVVDMMDEERTYWRLEEWGQLLAAGSCTGGIAKQAKKIDQAIVGKFDPIVNL